MTEYDILKFINLYIFSVKAMLLLIDCKYKILANQLDLEKLKDGESKQVRTGFLECALDLRKTIIVILRIITNFSYLTKKTD